LAGWRSSNAILSALAPVKAARAVPRGQKMGRPPKLTPHQQKEAIKRRDRGDESLTEIGHSYNVSVATISRLTAEGY
jgi:DNA invertase Pin-like site-specific DNA recombinase